MLRSYPYDVQYSVFFRTAGWTHRTVGYCTTVGPTGRNRGLRYRTLPRTEESEHHNPASAEKDTKNLFFWLMSTRGVPSAKFSSPRRG